MVLCSARGRGLARKEFVSVHVSGGTSTRCRGEGGVRLMQHALSLMKLVNLDPGLHGSCRTALRQHGEWVRRGSFCSPRCRKLPRAMHLSGGSQVKPVVFEHAQHSFVSQHCPRVIPKELRGKLQQARPFSPYPHEFLAYRS